MNFLKIHHEHLAPFPSWVPRGRVIGTAHPDFGTRQPRVQRIGDRGLLLLPVSILDSTAVGFV